MVFSVSSKGYPIRTGKSQSFIRGVGHYEASMDSREEIQVYLNDAVSTPDLPVVLRIEFVLRKKDRCQRREFKIMPIFTSVHPKNPTISF